MNQGGSRVCGPQQMANSPSPGLQREELEALNFLQMIWRS